jgi:hypothetical protein
MLTFVTGDILTSHLYWMVYTSWIPGTNEGFQLVQMSVFPIVRGRRRRDALHPFGSLVGCFFYILATSGYCLWIFYWHGLCFLMGQSNGLPTITSVWGPKTSEEIFFKKLHSTTQHARTLTPMNMYVNPTPMSTSEGLSTGRSGDSRIHHWPRAPCCWRECRLPLNT